MRFDRFVTMGVLRRIRRPGTRAGWGRVPVLMYHGITNEPEPGIAPYYQTNTSPEVFRQHIQWLAEAGYRSLSMEQLVDSIRANAPLATPERPLAVITFDDGFRNFYTEAFPVLKKYGFTATMFLPTAFVGETRRRFRPATSGARKAGGQECLTWQEIREMASQGIEFGSHTVNHPRLVELSWKEIGVELAASRQELQQQLGKPVKTFAYPFAFPQADVSFVSGFRALLAETGYTCCATTEVGRVGLGDDPYRLKRLPANGLDDPDFFRAKLEGGYDWLGVAQRAAKRVKRLGTRSRRRRPSCEAAPCPDSHPANS